MQPVNSKLPIHVFVLALDAMPWICSIFIEMTRIMDRPWTLHFIEGAAMNKGSTAWMNAQAPRLSKDGTTQFLDSLAWHPNVRIHRAARWESKDAMVNAPLEGCRNPISETCVLIQVDSDECWRADHIQEICRLFDADPELMLMRFQCRYFVGPDRVIVSKTGWTQEAHAWTRAWRFRPGMRWTRHEPPVLGQNAGKVMSRAETERRGLIFDHHAYTTEAQVRLKAELYGPLYADALDGWRRLQRHAEFPTQLKPFFGWVGPEVIVDRALDSPNQTPVEST